MIYIVISMLAALVAWSLKVWLDVKSLRREHGQALIDAAGYKCRINALEYSNEQRQLIADTVTGIISHSKEHNKSEPWSK